MRSTLAIQPCRAPRKQQLRGTGSAIHPRTHARARTHARTTTNTHKYTHQFIHRRAHTRERTHTPAQHMLRTHPNEANDRRSSDACAVLTVQPCGNSRVIDTRTHFHNTHTMHAPQSCTRAPATNHPYCLRPTAPTLLANAHMQQKARRYRLRCLRPTAHHFTRALVDSP